MTAKKVTKIKPKICLSDLKPKPYKLQLDVPGHPDLDVWVEIVGADSKEYTQAASDLFRERGGTEDKAITIDEAMIENAKLYSEIMLDWGPVEFFGEEFSKDAAFNVLKDYDYKWIRLQIEEAAMEREHFFTS